MANKQRGEISLTLDGEPHRLVLTFGALAELETELGLDNIAQLAERFSEGKIRMQDLICILGAALRAGGQDISNQQAGQMRCEGGAASLTRALVDLLHLTFGGLERDDAEPTGISTVNP